MRVERDDRAEVTVLVLAGRVGAEDHDAFDALVQKLLSESRTRLAVDASALEYINSSAIGSLVDYYRNAVAAGGGLAIVEPSATVRKVLDAVGISALVHISEDVDDAVSFLRSAAPG